MKKWRLSKPRSLLGSWPSYVPELTLLKLINPVNQVFDLWLQASLCRRKERLSQRRQMPGCLRRKEGAGVATVSLLLRVSIY